MELTNKLVELAGGMITIHPEVRDDGRGFLMFDDGGVEVEVAEFLYGIIRILKPIHILETGTYTGISSMYMGQALKDNGHGDILTLEIDSYHKNRAEDLWKRCGLSNIACRLEKSLDFIPTQEYEFIFLDSEPNLRFHELVKYFPNLKEGGYVFIHDAPRNLTQGNVNSDHPEIESWPFGNLPEEIKQWVREGKLRPIHFPNPRGLVGFYRPHKDDFKWQ